MADLLWAAGKVSGGTLYNPHDGHAGLSNTQLGHRLPINGDWQEGGNNMQSHERNQVRMYKTLDGQMAEADKFEVEALRLVQELAQERADKYSIPAFKFSDKLGYCWLMTGNRKRQTYYSEARIINDFNRSVAEVRAILHEDDATTNNATTITITLDEV